VLIFGSLLWTRPSSLFPPYLFLVQVVSLTWGSLAVLLGALIRSRCGWMVCRSTGSEPRHSSSTSWLGGHTHTHTHTHTHSQHNGTCCVWAKVQHASRPRYTKLGLFKNASTFDDLADVGNNITYAVEFGVLVNTNTTATTHTPCWTHPGPQAQDELGPLAVAHQLGHQLCHHGNKLLQHAVVVDQALLHHLPHGR